MKKRRRKKRKNPFRVFFINLKSKHTHTHYEIHYLHHHHHHHQMKRRKKKEDNEKEKEKACHEHYMGVRFRCQIMSLFLFSSIYYSYFFSSFSRSVCLSYSFVRLLMVKCLLRQVVTWSSLPGPILSSLSKPYNCACSHTFIHIRGLLLFQQQHTRVQIKQYTFMYAHRKLTTGFTYV
jgi:hypothetical protein